ncbi:MAG TPA: hypothetical protein VIS09_04770 [Streptomyces sp.]
MGGDGGGHDPFVQAGLTAATAKHEGEVAARFGKQVPTVKAPAVVHHEQRRDYVDGRQGDVDRSGPGPGSR